MDEIKMNIPKEFAISAYPLNPRLIGSMGEKEGLKIFIRDIILNDIDSFLSTDKSKELGGVLLGNAYKDEEGKLFIVINDIVIANFTKANLSRLTFTHETWEFINSEIEAHHKDKIMLGWFHSHPGHTVFLSSLDKFIHENYFNLDYMVAYVYDPVLDERAFFLWNDSSLIKSESYFVFNEVSKHLNLSLKKKMDEKETNNQNNSLFSKIILVLLVINFTAAGYLLFQYLQVEKELKNNSDLSFRVNALKNELTNLNAKLEAAKQKQDTLNNTAQNDVISYQVKAGDTLKKIALQYYNDAGKINLLIRYNNLKDEYDITTGQIIGIPLDK